MALVAAAIAVALMGHAVRLWVPGAEAYCEEIGVWSVRAGALKAAVAIGGALALLLVLCGTLAGRKSRTPFLVAALFLILLAFVAGAVYLR
jgi:hypothetical protein